MKLPKTFVPDKNLENSLENLVKKKPQEEDILKDLVISQRHGEELLYNTSLNRLKIEGYERHLRPDECFTLIARYLEGNLKEPLRSIAYNIVNVSLLDWLSIAFQRQGGILHCYLDPEGLVWNGECYAPHPKVQYSQKKEFDIKGIPSLDWVGLDRFEDGFVRFFYGKSFEELPEEFTDGIYKAQIVIPEENVYYAMARGLGLHKYSMQPAESANFRGVRKTEAKVSL